MPLLFLTMIVYFMDHHRSIWIPFPIVIDSKNFLAKKDKMECCDSLWNTLLAGAGRQSLRIHRKAKDERKYSHDDRGRSGVTKKCHSKSTRRAHWRLVHIVAPRGEQGVVSIRQQKAIFTPEKFRSRWQKRSQKIELHFCVPFRMVGFEKC